MAACQRIESGLDEMRASGLLTSRTSPAALVPPLQAQSAVLSRLHDHDPDRVVAAFRESMYFVALPARSYS